MKTSVLPALIFLSACVYLIGNGRVALWDRDEPRYAQTSRQMLHSGDWIVPRFLDKDRTAKPALIYWCQATAMAVFGDNNFAARFPSVVAIVLLLIVLLRTLRPVLGLEATAWTLFVFSTSGLTIAAAKMCITDAVLLLFVTTAQLCLYGLLAGRRSWKTVFLFAVAIGFAGLTKGPVVLGMLATTLAAMGIFVAINHWFPPAVESLVLADVRPESGVLDYAPPLVVSSEATIVWAPFLAKFAVGFLIVVAMILPWVLMVNHRSPAFNGSVVKHEIWDRMMTPLEQHVGPPGYYLLTIWVTFFPWSLLLPMVLVQAFHRRGDFRTRFALSAIVGPWLMLECVRTKLPHYLLPVFPPLAYLTAGTLSRNLARPFSDLRSKSFVIAAVVWGILVTAVASASWLVKLNPDVSPPIPAMVALSVFGAIFGCGVAAAFLLGRPRVAVLAMGLGTFGLFVVMYGIYLPRADFLRVSPRVAGILKSHAVTEPRQVMMLDYMEPSLAFAQGGTIREAGQLGFGKKFEPLLTPWLVLPRTTFDKAPRELRDDYEIIGDVYGLAYADRGKWVHVLVLHRRGSAS